MTGMTDVAPRADSRRRPAERGHRRGEALRSHAKAPVNLFLILLGLLWLIPTLGLFITSILPAQAFTVKGWWQIFSSRASPPGRTTASVLHNHSITHSLWITPRSPSATR